MYVVKWVEIDQNAVIPNIRRKRKVDGERVPIMVFFFLLGGGVKWKCDTPRYP